MVAKKACRVARALSSAWFRSSRASALIWALSQVVKSAVDRPLANQPTLTKLPATAKSSKPA